MRGAYVRGGGCVLAAMIAVAGCASNTSLPLEDFNKDTKTPERKSTQSGTTTEVPQADAGAPTDAATACATVPPNNRCGLSPQCGCGPNETCEVTNETTGATSCVTAGSATLGRPCTQTGDCLAGNTCAYGACRPYCTKAGTTCAIGGTELCTDITDVDDKPMPNKSVCTIQCDPRVPSAVCGTNACEWFADYYAPTNKISDCNFGGTKAALEVCDVTSDCLPGLACNDHPKYGPECEKWCRIGQAPSDCAAGFTCKDIFGANAPVVFGVKEGLCQD